MLQIVTKMYFRDGAPLHSSVHRDVLYTNCHFLPGSLVELPVGEIAPSTGLQQVPTVTLSVTEHLEAEHPDERASELVATGGTEFIDELADVLSFGLNAVFSRDGDLVRRLVRDSTDGARGPSARTLFRRTFESNRFVLEPECDELRRFMRQLLALERDYFEAAMRAIRRIVRATQRAADDPTVAYVDLVAALESLSEGTSASPATWDRLDGRKRKLIDAALEGADAGVAERVREAVMEAERLGAKSKFVAFVLGNVSPKYFRAEASDAVRPVRGADLERILKLAYDIRSRSIHVLEALPPEAWVLGDGAEIVSPPETGTMLSHEGLARLARHVVRSYVDRAPAGVDATFDWRASLPGQVRVRVAPQYWIWKAEQFDQKSAGRYFSGFAAYMADMLAEREECVPDMGAVLEHIEQLVPGSADGQAKTLMVSIYALWHRRLTPSDHRPRAASFLAKHERLLDRVEAAPFVVGLLTNQMPGWTTDQWHTLATDRREQRSKRSHLELRPSFDAALQVIATEQLMEAGRAEEALMLARFAVDELPGNEQLIAWESGLAAGTATELDLRALVLQVEPGARPQEQTQTSQGAGEPPAESEIAEHEPADDGRQADDVVAADAEP